MGCFREIVYFVAVMEAENVVLISPEEYLESEKESEIKHEYLGGTVHAMSGASKQHNRIAGSIYRLLASKIGAGPCEPFIGDVKVHLKTAISEFFYYPDVVVGCDPEDNNEYYLENPAIIFEVLSPSTENIDRREKLLAYQSIESLEHYVIVSQEKMEIEWLHRSGEGWKVSKLIRPADALEFSEQGATLLLSEIYEGIDFPAENEG